MEENDFPMAVVILGDGTRLANLKVNGDNFISSEELTVETFDNNLDGVVIDTEDGPVTHAHMELVQLIQFQGEWWFVLRDLTAAELESARLRADVEYLAMMTDVELEEA